MLRRGAGLLLKIVLVTLAGLLVPLPLLLLVTRGFSGQFFTRTRDAQAALGEMSGRVQASVAGVRVVRSFALEEREAEAFEVTNQKYLDKSLGLARWRGSPFTVSHSSSAPGSGTSSRVTSQGASTL